MSLGVAPFDRHKAVISLLMFEILFHFPNKSDDVACGLFFFFVGGEFLRRPPSRQTSFLCFLWRGVEDSGMADCPRTDIQGRELTSFYVLVLEEAEMWTK